MDINLLKRLIRVVEKSEITEFSIEEGELKVKISKAVPAAQQIVAQPQVVQAVPAATQASEQVTAAVESSGAEQNDTSGNFHEIKSPIVGTFYRAPAPDADPYAQVGDTISDGSVLCIVEAMKLMNEIESDVSGKIVKILVENATPVEYNQPLFLIEKS